MRARILVHNISAGTALLVRLCVVGGTKDLVAVLEAGAGGAAPVLSSALLADLIAV